MMMKFNQGLFRVSTNFPLSLSLNLIHWKPRSQDDKCLFSGHNSLHIWQSHLEYIEVMLPHDVPFWGGTSVHLRSLGHLFKIMAALAFTLFKTSHRTLTNLALTNLTLPYRQCPVLILPWTAFPNHYSVTIRSDN